MEQDMDPARLEAVIAFLQIAERLKDTLRSGRTAGGRRESAAEHSWRLALLALLLERDLAGADLLKLLKLCLVHDLGEAISGDVPATEQAPDDGRAARERADMATLCAVLPADLRAEMMALWDEYADGTTPEAVLAKGLDKIETVLQHGVGANAPGFDYAFNLAYGRGRTQALPLLRQIRAQADATTRARMAAEEALTPRSPPPAGGAVRRQ